MKTIGIFTIFILVCTAAFSQEINIRRDAETMGKALVDKDYANYVNFTYPKILKDMGGKEKMIVTIKKQMDDVNAQGAHIVSISFDKPSVIVKEKNELQATVPQTVIFETANGKMEARNTLIAISADDGVHWYFIDPGERDLETVRITLPNLSKKLILAPSEPIKQLK